VGIERGEGKMLPRVVLHNSVSVDGRVDGFIPDIGLHYEMASHWKADVHLAGSNTILSQGGEVSAEDEETFQPAERDPDDPRSLLAIPDSRGRVRIWHTLRRSGYWRDVMALCSKTTPRTYLDYLKERRIDYIIAGDDHVDMRSALEELSARYGAKTVLLDSGGTLNGILLRAGLVDEVSVLIHPCLVGGTTPGSIFRAPDPTAPGGEVKLRLTHVEKVKEDLVWLRYEVVR
jgi:2,5-diamino-6-(ribosylamino)-4(3H)-pyrimidinone 5'-phosphate reductase